MKKFFISKQFPPMMEKYRTFLIVIMIGLLLMLIPTSCEQGSELDSSQTEPEFSVESVQKEIEAMLAKSEGVGRVKVMLTLKSSIEHIYAEESQITRNHEETDSDRKPSIISDGSGKEIPVLIKQMYPEFLGATVVCDGAEHIKVRTFITEMIYALTGITADRIAIIKMKQ